MWPMSCTELAPRRSLRRHTAPFTRLRSMFREPLRSRADLARVCLALAFGLTLCSSLAWAQDRSTYERLDRLERDLNMLQRHVYRGAPGYAPDGGTAVDAQLRMDRLETQL